MQPRVGPNQRGPTLGCDILFDNPERVVSQSLRHAHGKPKNVKIIDENSKPFLFVRVLPVIIIASIASGQPQGAFCKELRT
jgi:hypothetical protein